MSQHTRKSADDKVDRPKKPRPDFPCFPMRRAAGPRRLGASSVTSARWPTTPRARAALDLWLEQKDDLLAGRTPRVSREGLTLRELLDRYVVSKRHLLDTREISSKHFSELYACCKRIGDAFGLTRLVVDLAADDFDKLRRAIAKKWGPIRLGNEVQRVRSVFKFGYDSGLIAQPVRFGPGFKKPSRRVVRVNRAKNGARMFDAADVRTIIDKAAQPMKAMVLLGINCGFGNSDVANLPAKAIDLKAGWVDYPRPKTGIPRRCPLWPETLAAVKEAMQQRPRPRSPADAGLLFLTVQGNPWEKTGVSKPDPETGKITVTDNNPVTQQFGKLLQALKLHRRGLGFYALRHSFETIAGGSKDQVAVDALMGHVDDSMAATYRERIDDARLLAVTEHVRKWLFGTEDKQ